MRRFVLACAVAVCAAAAFGSTSAKAAGQNQKLDFTLVNKTGFTIDSVFVSPADDDDWGEDVMGKDVLDNGESVEITFSPKEKACKWDLKVVDSDKDEVEWTEIDLCKASEITLKYENKKPTAVIK